MKLAVIPARGGSKRILRKNIKPFGGLPMISWSIRAALTSNCFDRIIVSTDDAEIQDGLEIVQRQLANRTVRAGEEELFKARAKEQGRVKLIDLVRARLDVKNDCFVAELPSVRINDARIPDEMVHTHDRMLTGGFYAEVDLTYDPTIAEEKSGRPFGIEALREIQLSKSDALASLYRSYLINASGFASSHLSRCWS